MTQTIAIVFWRRLQLSPKSVPVNRTISLHAWGRFFFETEQFLLPIELLLKATLPPDPKSGDINRATKRVEDADRHRKRNDA